MAQSPRYSLHPSPKWQSHYDRSSAHLPQNAFLFRTGSCGVSHLAIVEYDYEHEYEYEYEYDSEIIHPFETRDLAETLAFDVA